MLHIHALVGKWKKLQSQPRGAVKKFIFLADMSAKLPPVSPIIHNPVYIPCTRPVRFPDYLLPSVHTLYSPCTVSPIIYYPVYIPCTRPVPFPRLSTTRCNYLVLALARFPDYPWEPHLGNWDLPWVLRNPSLHPSPSSPHINQPPPPASSSHTGH